MKRPAIILLVPLFLLWILPGNLGRDPWKADEPYSLGIVNNMLRTGDWVVPAIAGEPFLEKPPLYFLTAAAAVRVFSPPLAPHDAARLVNIFWMALALIALGSATQEIAGSSAGLTAPVLLMGSFLLQVPAHKLLTDVALLAGFSVGLWGLAIGRSRPFRGGLLTGTGIGIGFLAKGLIAPGILCLIAAVLPLVDARWRTGTFGKSMAAAVAAGLPWLLLWPALLALRSREAFLEWFWYQNLGRFLGFANAPAQGHHYYYLLNLAWIGFPWIYLALWALWRRNRVGMERLTFPATAFSIIFIVLSLSASNRQIYALPLLLPIAMAAAAGLDNIGVGAASRTARSIRTAFNVAAMALSILWILLITEHSAFARFPDHAEMSSAFIPYASGAAIACIVIWRRLRRIPDGLPAIASAWSKGVVLLWCLAMTLFLPWLESLASYRDVFSDLRTHLPDRYACLNTYGLGESERAMVEYYAGLRSRPLNGTRHPECDLLLVGSGRRTTAVYPALEPVIQWEGTRPKENPKEHYVLYRVTPPGPRTSPESCCGVAP